MQDAMPALSLEKHSPAFNKKDRKINSCLFSVLAPVPAGTEQHGNIRYSRSHSLFGHFWLFLPGYR